MTPESQDNFPLRSVFLRMVWQMLFPEEGVLEVLFSHYTHTHTHTHTHKTQTNETAQIDSCPGAQKRGKSYFNKELKHASWELMLS